MNKLSIEEMEEIEGGSGCRTMGTISAILTLAGVGLAGAALLATNPWLIAGLIATKYSISIANVTFSAAGLVVCGLSS